MGVFSGGVEELLTLKKMLDMAELRGRIDDNQWMMDELKKAMMERDHKTARAILRMCRNE